MDFESKRDVILELSFLFVNETFEFLVIFWFSFNVNFEELFFEDAGNEVMISVSFLENFC